MMLAFWFESTKENRLKFYVTKFYQLALIPYFSKERVWRVRIMDRRLLSIAKYLMLMFVAVVLIYSVLNSLTLFIWGDSSLHGEPRLFHPAHIVILHYARMISPILGKCVEIAIFCGIGFLAYFGFRQLTAKNLLDHPLRRDIVRFIEMHPGQHFRSIMRGTGINRGTLYYHLMQLKSLKMITEVKDGGLTRYFLRMSGLSVLEKKILNHYDNPTRDQIITVLRNNATVSKVNLQKIVGASGPSLWYHMHILINDEIVSAELDGREKRYSLTWDAAAIIDSEVLESGSVEITRVPSGFPLKNISVPDENSKVRV
jgi:predicted transcriptional regulator